MGLAFSEYRYCSVPQVSNQLRDMLEYVYDMAFMWKTQIKGTKILSNIFIPSTVVRVFIIPNRVHLEVASNIIIVVLVTVWMHTSTCVCKSELSPGVHVDPGANQP